MQGSTGFQVLCIMKLSQRTALFAAAEYCACRETLMACKRRWSGGRCLARTELPSMWHHPDHRPLPMGSRDGQWGCGSSAEVDIHSRCPT